MKQKILSITKNYSQVDSFFFSNQITSFLLVCGKTMKYSLISNRIKEIAQRNKIKIIKFDDFNSNPSYESVVKGVKIFRDNKCNGIVAVGGGSAIDVAKCIKLYSSMNGDGNNGSFLCQSPIPNDIKFLAIPTTAGTGSEATRYAVIYYNGEKQSITHDSLIPDAILMDSNVLRTLPLYQKKATMFDAFCHSIESFWSINSTDLSRAYSKKAIKIILQNMDGYLENENVTNEEMLKASHIAGKAINITQTTAGHAMSYKMSSLYKIAHGHAVALCVKELWPWMIKNIERSIEPRGKVYLTNMFKELGEAMQCNGALEGAQKFACILEKMELEVPVVNYNDYNILKSSVNSIRLKNTPILMDIDTIDYLYHRILEG